MFHSYHKSSAYDGLNWFVIDGRTVLHRRDNQGSVRLVVDAATGAVAQRLDYDSFGQVLVDTNPGFQPFGFQGGLYDPDAGLVEFGSRWYDAQTGRWLSKDPIGLNGGMNLYEFCGGDALNMCDPCGCAVEIGLIGARAAAVLGVHASMSLLLNEKGRIGIKFKGGVGAGVEVGVKGPWNAKRVIRYNSPSVGDDGSNDIEFGIEHGIEGHGGVVVGISFDPTGNQPVNGVEVGSIGGGVYTSSAVILPIFDPSWMPKCMRTVLK